MSESYQPPAEIRSLFELDRDLLREVQDNLRNNGSSYDVIKNYCQSIESRVYGTGKRLIGQTIDDPDEQKRLARENARKHNNGNNFVYAILLGSQLDEGGLNHLVAEGEDLQIGLKSLSDKQDDLEQSPSFKLWAGLYLDLREEIFGPEQNEENVEVIKQLREMIAG